MECFIIEDFEFKTTSEATVSVFAYVNKRASRIEIPSQIESKGFLGFGRKTYTITKIEDAVFRGMAELINVTIPSSVTSIGSNLFEGCSKLQNVVLSENIKGISYSMFENCSSLTEIIVPQSIEEISYNAFKNCISLKEIALPENICIIRSSAFEGCTSLEKLGLPKSLEEVGEDIFRDCDKLLQKSGDLLLSKDGKICFGLTIDKSKCPSEIKIPESVLFIANNAFEGCEHLIKVTLPKDLKTIGDYAFANCHNLTNINIPSHLERIGCYAFNNCENLQDIVLPETLTSIGEDAFVACDSFTKMVIPDSVTYIGYIGLDECFARWEVIVSENHPCMEDLECLDDRLVIIGNDEDAEETDEETDEETILLEKCEQGDAEAMDELGFYYWIEDDDAEKALYWYQKSAALKYPQGMIDLGRCYIGAYDTSQCDYEKAITLFTEAAHLGCADGYYGLGVCYAEGLGVEKDRKKARELLLKAVEMGSEDAECYLDEEYDEE